jgi:hypothetical protein
LRDIISFFFFPSARNRNSQPNFFGWLVVIVIVIIAAFLSGKFITFPSEVSWRVCRSRRDLVPEDCFRRSFLFLEEKLMEENTSMSDMANGNVSYGVAGESVRGFHCPSVTVKSYSTSSGSCRSYDFSRVMRTIMTAMI